MATSTEHEKLEQVLRGQQALMDDVHQWLEEEQKHDQVLRAVVLSSRKERPVQVKNLDPDRIFSINTIRDLCIKYRLRFLDAGLFKGDIPSQAIHAIRSLEQRAPEPITSFKIMAPAGRFKLCDSEVDPLLFMPVGNDRYYLIHKWGSDLSPWRIVVGWPSRTPLTLATSVVLLATFIGVLMPAHLLELWTVDRILFTLWCVMVCSSFTVFGWFAFFGQFSSQAWNSRFFNS